MLWTSKVRRSEVLTDFLNHESTILYSPLAFLVVFLLFEAVAEHEWEELCKDCSPSLCYVKLPSSEIFCNYQVLVSSEGNHIHHSSEGTFWPNPH